MERLLKLAAEYLDASEQLATVRPGVEDRAHERAREVAKLWPTVDTPTGQEKLADLIARFAAEDLQKLGGAAEAC